MYIFALAICMQTNYRISGPDNLTKLSYTDRKSTEFKLLLQKAKLCLRQLRNIMFVLKVFLLKF